jgi:hypothetical protein
LPKHAIISINIALTIYSTAYHNEGIMKEFLYHGIMNAAYNRTEDVSLEYPYD